MSTAIAIKSIKTKLPGTPPPRYEDFLSRTETADLLGCSVPMLRCYERTGRLTRHVAERADSRGQVRQLILYDPAEVKRLPRKVVHAGRDKGESAARAFEYFKLGMPISDVVIEVRELPAQVMEWHDQWLRCGGAAITVHPHARDALVALIGDFKTVAELVERVRDRVQKLTAELAATRAARSSE